LEPLDKNLPNVPVVVDTGHRVVAVNRGGFDSGVSKKIVTEAASWYMMRFFNTSIARNLDSFPGPVVLTINPELVKLEAIPKNLMFVRFRTNTWNLKLCDDAVKYYTERYVPVVLTFMAYDKINSVPETRKCDYTLRERTINKYWAITTKAWRKVMKRYEDNLLVYSCGKIEGEKGNSHCRYCGNCIREYFATMERLRCS
jgi:hypothetical protein